MGDKKNVSYSVIITEIDNETGAEKEVHDGLYHSVCMLAEDADKEERMCEIMLNENLVGLASMIAASEKHRLAARLALDVLDVYRRKSSALEDMLMDMIAEGDVQ